MVRLRRDRDERGATTIMVAFLSLALFAAAALAIDISTLAMERQKLHDHIDSAAHAGAFMLPNDGAKARNAAVNMAVDQDGKLTPSASLYCVVASTPDYKVNTAQIPATCNPGAGPYTAAKYPGLMCDAQICAIPCAVSSSTMCNTIEVVEDKNVPYGFARILGINQGNTGAIASAACKGSCGTETPNPLDVVVMADRTASMRYGDRASMKTAILESLKSMNPEMHYVAFGALHKSRTTGFTPKSKTYGPQNDDYGILNTSDNPTLLNYNGHWDGTEDRNGDGYCRTEAYTRAPASAATPKIFRWGRDGAPDRPDLNFTNVTTGTWVPVPFSNDYLVTGATVPTLNNGSAVVDGIACLPQSISGEYGTHLASALKGAVAYALANNPAPSRPGKIRKVVIFETDGMPDESPRAGTTALDSGDLSGGQQTSGGPRGCQNFVDVAELAKDRDVLVITIGFGDAATKRCVKGSSSSGRLVRDVLAEAASPVAPGVPSTANSCQGADIAKENTDGDYFFCATSGNELGDIFKTAIQQVSTNIRLLKLPKPAG